MGIWNQSNAEALLIRIGFWGRWDYNYHKDPPPKKKHSMGKYLGFYIRADYYNHDKELPKIVQAIT